MGATHKLPAPASISHSGQVVRRAPAGPGVPDEVSLPGTWPTSQALHSHFSSLVETQE